MEDKILYDGKKNSDLMLESMKKHDLIRSLGYLLEIKKESIWDKENGKRIKRPKRKVIDIDLDDF